MYGVARRVVVLDKESGEVVLTVGGRPGSEPGQLSSPTGLAVEPSSSEGGKEEPALLWVLDAGNARLQAFDKATGATTTTPHQIQADSHADDSHRPEDDGRVVTVAGWPTKGASPVPSC